MKRRVYIAMMALAAVMLLTVSIVPHHHHFNALCNAVEHCADDNADNDRHTHHGGDDTGCAVNGYVAFAKTAAHHGFYFDNRTVPLSSFAMCGTGVSYTFHSPFPSRLAWGKGAACVNAETCRMISLRAPPAYSVRS